jgi:uncharacterized protein
MRIVVECAHVVVPLFEAVLAEDQALVSKHMDTIFELEEQADQIKNGLRTQLPRSLFMPVDRRDLLEVLQMQDTIADIAQDIAGLVVQRKMTVPEPLKATLLPFVQKCVDTCDHSLKVIEELDELLEMGFRGRGRDEVEAMLTELNDIETETDDLGQAAATTLFEYEDEMKPVSVMMWYQLIDWIGDLADYAEKVGDRIRLLIAR